MNLLLAWLAFWQLTGPEFPYGVDASVAYKEVGGEALVLDVFHPSRAAGPVPAVVFVHGGMWAWGRRSDYMDFAGALACAGMGAVLVEFRKADGQGFQEQVEDLKDAIRWVRDHAPEYGFDPNRIGLFGSSSGGHLAALAAFAGDGEGFGDDPPGQSSRVQACYLLYGVYDLEGTPGISPLWAAVIRAYMGGSYEERPEAYALFSPMAHIDGSEPPTLLMHGTEDRMVPIEQAERCQAALEAAGVPATLLPVEGMGHGFARLRRGTRPEVIEALMEFFEETWGAPPGAVAGVPIGISAWLKMLTCTRE
jgi:acetyl esterase/lipase